MKKSIKLTLFICLFFIVNSCSKGGDSSDQSEEQTMSLKEQNDIANEMFNLYEGLLLQNTPEISRELLVEELIRTPDIKDAGISEDETTVWWEYKDGLEYYYFTVTVLSNLTSKSSNNIKKQSFSKRNDIIIPENKNALVLAPYNYELLNLSKHDYTIDMASLINENNYDVNFKINSDSKELNITLDDYKQFNNYSVIFISTHGGVTNKGEVGINSGVPFTEELKTSLKDHLDKKRVAVGHSREWWLLNDSSKTEVVLLTSSWFDYVYQTKLNRTLVYMAVCNSYHNNTLANALIGNQSAYFGWTHNVSAGSDKKAAFDLFNHLFDGKTVEDAYKQVVENGNSVHYDEIQPAIFKKSANSYNDLALIEPLFKDAAAVRIILETNGIDVSDPRWDSKNIDDIKKVLNGQIGNWHTRVYQTNNSGFDRVKELSLDKDDISVIPPEIGLLTELQNIEIYRKSGASGPTAKTFGDLETMPEEIGNLTKLKTLTINWTKLSTLPNSITNLNNLEHLSFRFNNLTSLPNNIGDLSKLRYLDLYGNKLTVLPDSFTLLTLTDLFDINYNISIKCLPQHIWDTANIQSLSWLFLDDSTSISSFGDVDCSQ